MIPAEIHRPSTPPTSKRRSPHGRWPKSEAGSASMRWQAAPPPRAGGLVLRCLSSLYDVSRAGHAG